MQGVTPTCGDKITEKKRQYSWIFMASTHFSLYKAGHF